MEGTLTAKKCKENATFILQNLKKREAFPFKPEILSIWPTAN